jgi:type II secretory pathway component GspD/PulD (secretin)
MAGLIALIPLLGVGCSSWVFEDKSEEELAAEAALLEPDEAELVEQDVQSRFSLVRVLPHPEGSIYPYTAFVSLPLLAGERILERLEFLCTCDDRESSPAILELTASGGGTILGNVKAGPAGGDLLPKYTDIEDVLMIRGTEADIEEVLIALDMWFNSAPQIQIEATVWEVTDLDSFSRGVEGMPLMDWGDQTTLVQSMVSSFQSTKNSGGLIELAFTDGEFNLQAGLSVLQEIGLVDILSKPSVVTRNGVPATMSSTEQIPVLEPGVFNANGTTGLNIKYRDVGITLHVVPFLVGADTIHLVIDAEVSRLGRDFFVGVDGNGQQITAPSTSKRRATTNVYVKNGTDIVFGGLVLDDTIIEEQRVPFLGAVPLVGWLFSSKSETKVKTQVFFRIRPTVKEILSIDPIGDIFDPFAEE